jgi:hypothetical protein
MASVWFMPSDFACLSAASVSAVSPDCEMVTTSAFGFGDRFAVAVLAAISTGHRHLAIDSIQ